MPRLCILMFGVYHPIVCRETTAQCVYRIVSSAVYHPIVCRETTAELEI